MDQNAVYYAACTVSASEACSFLVGLEDTVSQKAGFDRTRVAMGASLLSPPPENALPAPVMMATWYAPLLVFLHDIKPAAALYLSLLACLRNMRAMMLYGLALMIPLFFFTRAGMLIGQVDLGLWMLAPLIVPSS